MRIAVVAARGAVESIDAVDLRWDGVQEIASEVRLPEDHALVEVHFDCSPAKLGGDVRCAVCAYSADWGWLGDRVPICDRAPGVLLLLRPGTWDLSGATQTGDAVLSAETTSLRVHAGDRTLVWLRTVCAGRIRFPSTPKHLRGEAWACVAVLRV